MATRNDVLSTCFAAAMFVTATIHLFLSHSPFQVTDFFSTLRQSFSSPSTRPEMIEKSRTAAIVSMSVVLRQLYVWASLGGQVAADPGERASGHQGS